MKNYWVYIVSNKNNNVIYVGVTSELEKRIYQHKHKLIRGFTSKYNLNKLVYFEGCGDVESAILREKQLKRWSRKKKDELIRRMNKSWEDLSLKW